MSFTPTPEQLDVVAAAKGSSDNLIISALAGAAKTSTLILIGKALISTPILCLAFNKKIAVEMSERLPGNCQSMTLNSLGHRAWGQALGRKNLRVDAKKSFNILKEIVDHDLNPKEKEEAYDNFSEILRTIEHGKSQGYVPDGAFPNANPLFGDDDFFASLEEEPSHLEESLIRAVSSRSIKMGFDGMIDFSDQILLPTVFPVSFPQFPCVMIDEAQDLSALNHRTLKKLAKKRLIAVGDEHQAIYGFRGAHEQSMAEMQQSFSMRKLILSVSFRCPISVVELARFRAPHMQYPDWAVQGEVRRPTEWSTDDIPDNAAIICRNNAPLFSIAIKLLKNGRYPQLIGNDIGKTLTKWMKKLGQPSMKQSEVLIAIDQWRDDKLKKSRSPGKVEDQAECMRIFVKQAPDLGGAIAYAEHIMTASGPIQLMTCHKSKGLEFDNVFFLDQKLLGTETQEQNLRYVIVTRAKQTLTFVNSEDFVDMKEDE